jgi:drug/metabolite transporter (DMT)-like permease
MDDHARRYRASLGLALAAAILWGILPFALHIVLEAMDPVTVTWGRLASAALLLAPVLAWRGALPAPWRLGAAGRWLLSVAVVGLAGNYLLFASGVRFTTPAAAQVVIQLGHFFVLAGGLLFLGERFNARQWTGLALLLVGLALFFNHQLPLLFTTDRRAGLGALLVTLGSLMWGAYALAQKRLLHALTSAQLLWLLYLGGALLLTPFAHPGAATHLDARQGWSLAFCCFNTVAAYGAYAEAIKLGEVARVSAIACTSPLFTLACAGLLAAAPGTGPQAQAPGALAWLGAAAVVLGSMLCALGPVRPADAGTAVPSE